MKVQEYTTPITVSTRQPQAQPTALMTIEQMKATMKLRCVKVGDLARTAGYTVSYVQSLFRKGSCDNTFTLTVLTEALHKLAPPLYDGDDEDDSQLFWSGSCGLGFLSCALASIDHQTRPIMPFAELKR